MGLDDVLLIPRTRLVDSRGWLLKVLTGEEAHLSSQVGEIYVVQVEPGRVRGNHYHERAAEWFTVLSGAAELILCDADSGRRRAILLEAERPVTVYVPRRVAHAFRNVQKPEPALVLTYADRRYEPADTIAVDLS